MTDEKHAAADAATILDEARLVEFIRQNLPGAEAISLSDVTPASGGLSRDHFFFDLRWSEGSSRHERPLVLIRDGDRPGQTDRGGEFELLRALGQTTIPTPEAYWCDTSGQWLERPFIVMQRVGGAVTPPFQIAYPDSPAKRQKLTERFVDVLGDLHLLDWMGLGIDFLDTTDCEMEDFARTAAGAFQATVKTLGILEPNPTIERALAWCVEHAPRTRRWSICHGDYKPDNVLHEDGEILAVIDWERARIGDPMADLSYVCAPHLRVGSLACGLAEPDYVLRRYEERTGFEVDPRAIQFWQVHILLLTYLYFHLRTADAARRGRDADALVKPLMDHLLNLIEQTLN